MGFYFLNQQSPDKRQSKQQRSLATLNKIGCAACPLNRAKVKSPKMQPTLVADCDVYFLGEAPGQHEDETSGRPFTGPSGALLRYVLSGSSLKFSFDNVVRDRPPNNRDPTNIEIECCRGLVTKSIEQAKPKIIVGLGAHAQNWVLGSLDQAGMRGRVFAVKVGNHSCWFMPTYHPARVLHSASEQAKKQGRRSKSDDNGYLVTTYFGRTFKLDIEKALFYSTLPPPDIEEESGLRSQVYTFDGQKVVLPVKIDSAEKRVSTELIVQSNNQPLQSNIGVDLLLELLNKAKRAPHKAIDIETNALRPYNSGAAILTVAISFGTINFAFALDHRLSKWDSLTRQKILDLLESILVDDTIKIAHNCFSGDTEVITNEGIKTLKGLSGKNATIWTEKGWKEAKIRCFGKQPLKKLTVIPYNRSRNKIKHEILTTNNHNWVAERMTWIKPEKKYKYLRSDDFVQTKDIKCQVPNGTPIGPNSGDKLVAAVPNSREPDTYSKGFIHGLIFADGSLRKRRGKKDGSYHHNIRLCGWKSKFADRFNRTTQPPSANGDHVCNWYKSNINCKELPPEGSSAEYVQDFIEGWQLFDGADAKPSRIVTTVDENAAIWLAKNASVGGWYVTGFRPHITVNFSNEEIPIWSITITKDSNMGWTVTKIEDTDLIEDVYCAIVDEIGCFSLGPGIYTGNCPFECEWFIHYFGKGVVRHETWECTQLQAHFLDERRGAGQSSDDTSRRATYQSLDFLVRLHFGLSYKATFKIDRKNIANADLNETLVYNATDSRLTLRLWYTQTELLRTSGLYNAYIAAVPRQPTIALTQYLGMPVNQATVKKLQRKLGDEIAILQAEIEELDVVKQYIKDHKTFNPVGEDAIKIFRDYLKRKEIQVQDGARLRWSVDKHVLEKVDHPLAKLIVKLRNKSKMKSTYIDGLELGKGKYIYPDSKIHCNFNATFTTTGRFSSDELNMQNFPHRSDAWVREQIEAPEGHVIVAADYGQLEMCGAAMCSKDPYLVKVLWDDYDTHFFWSSRLAGICPDLVGGDFSDTGTAKRFRSLVKNKLVFPAIYGATNQSIAGYLGCSQHYIDQLMDEFWDTFKGIKKWQDKLLRKYRETGYVESPTGRRRHHPLTANEAINAPIQCLASEIVVEAMCKLSYMASTENKWHLHPRLNVHDDLTLIVPEKKLVSSIETIYTIMLTPSIMELIPKEARVPLSVTVSMGKDWFHMEEVGKFWSHKDIG